MTPLERLTDLVHDHQKLGRESAEVAFAAVFGDGLSNGSTALNCELSRMRMLSEVRKGLAEWGADDRSAEYMLAAASLGYSQRFFQLMNQSKGGHA